MPIPERPADLSDSRSTYPYSGPSEIPSAEQNVDELTAREQKIQGTSGEANCLRAILEYECARR
jgi:hypothetical protein